MKTYVNLWDYFFGKWGEIHIPMADGSVKMVAATEKWMKTMEAQGKMQQANSTIVMVHVLDLASDMIRAADMLLADADRDEILAAMAAKRPGPTVEHWDIGKQISLEEYQKAKDPR